PECRDAGGAGVVHDRSPQGGGRCRRRRHLTPGGRDVVHRGGTPDRGRAVGRGRPRSLGRLRLGRRSRRGRHGRGRSRRGPPMKWRRSVFSVVAPVVALFVALLVSSVALLLIHKNPLDAFRSMISYGTQGNQLISIVNAAIPLYIAALAVAIG